MTAGGNAQVRTFQLRPADCLRPYIDRIWGWEGEPGRRVALPTLLPGTGAEAFFHYRTPFRRAEAAILPHAHLLCVRRAPLALQPNDHLGFIAVRFRAGMLHRFTAVPAPELMDSARPLAELWGCEAAELAERIADADSFAARAQLVQDFLLRRLSCKPADRLVEQAVAAIYRDCADISIEHLAARLGSGRRQLERRFRQLTGQTPVEVRRVSRLQKTVRALLLDSSARCADTALAHGYYDQAHFIRDFRELAQDSPQRHIDAARMKSHFYNTPWRA